MFLQIEPIEQNIKVAKSKKRREILIMKTIQQRISVDYSKISCVKSYIIPNLSTPTNAFVNTS